MNVISKFCLFASGIVLLSLSACKKNYLDRKPTDVVPIEDAFKTTIGCKAALEGIHGLLYHETDHDEFGQKTFDLANDLMGDDMPVSGQGAGWFVSYINYSNAQTGIDYLWTYYYNIINNCNALLEHVDDAEGPQEEKDNIKGQTYFYRAFAYFNLSIYYQHTYFKDKTALGVPVYVEVTQEGKARATLDEVYSVITSDLDKSVSLLDGSFPRDNKSEINVDVARGLYARVALVMQEWQKAASLAELARQNYPYMSANQLLDGFSDWGNTSWMWASHINEEQTGIYASFLSQMVVSLNGYAALGQQKLINKALYKTIPNDATTGDVDIRAKWWFASASSPYVQYSQNKFKAKTAGSFSSDVCYMRAAEMGLIQAEAEAHFNLPAAKKTLTDLMIIRNPNYDIDDAIAARNFKYSDNASATVSETNKVIAEIWHERRIELWGEGFRFSDLQRCAAIDGAKTVFEDLPPLGGGGPLYYSGLHREYSANQNQSSVYGSAKTFNDVYDSRFLFHIPQSELNYNPNMVDN